VQLFRRLFEPYGPIYTDECSLPTRQRKSVGMYARLNRSFDFLLPKQDDVPMWVLSDQETLVAFFAGYTDAEGYIQTRTPRGYRTPQVRLELRSTDAQILMRLADGLRRIGVKCPPVAPRVPAGYLNGRGIVSRKTQWGLAVCRSDALLDLFRLMDPYLKHRKRRADMERARLAVLRQRRTPVPVSSTDRQAGAQTIARADLAMEPFSQ
jgi:hypothetical protein